MKQQFVEIQDYENIYGVSSNGKIIRYSRVVSNNSNNGRILPEMILSPLLDKYGYEVVNLYSDGYMKTKKVHRLVAQAFLPNPDDLPEVNHKDEDKTNNHVDNLEWCSSKYNTNYGSCIIKSSSKGRRAVVGFCPNCNVKKIEFDSITLARNSGYKDVSRSIKKGTKCNGLIFKYKK